MVNMNFNDINRPYSGILFSTVPQEPAPDLADPIHLRSAGILHLSQAALDLTDECHICNESPRRLVAMHPRKTQDEAVHAVCRDCFSQLCKANQSCTLCRKKISKFLIIERLSLVCFSKLYLLDPPSFVSSIHQTFFRFKAPSLRLSQTQEEGIKSIEIYLKIDRIPFFRQFVTSRISSNLLEKFDIQEPALTEITSALQNMANQTAQNGEILSSERTIENTKFHLSSHPKRATPNYSWVSNLMVLALIAACFYFTTQTGM